MNAVTSLIGPKVPASGGVPRAQASREDEAAFSPALMLLLAAGLNPTPQLQVVVPVPDALSTELSGGESSLDGADLGMNTGEQVASEWGALPTPAAQSTATLGTVPTQLFKAVAPAPLDASWVAPSVTVATSHLEAAAPAVPAPSAASTAATTRPAMANAAAQATPDPLPVPFGAQVHIEARSFATRDPRLVQPGVQAAPVEAFAPVVAPPATDTARHANALPTPEVTLQNTAPATLPAAALLVNAQPSAGLGIAKSTTSTTTETATIDSAPASDTPPSGESVLDSARRAAAVANHPTQKLKRAAVKQAATPLTDEPAVAAATSRTATGLKDSAAKQAPVQQAPAELPATFNVPQPAAPAIVSTEGFTARSSQNVPEDPRLDSLDGARNTVGRPDQVTLRVDGEAGEEARLRIAVRGRDVRATIVTEDASLARRLEDGLGSLRNALGDRGFERAQLQIQGAPVKAGEAPQDSQRDPAPKSRQQDPDSPTKHGKQSETPEQRSRSRNGRNQAER